MNEFDKALSRLTTKPVISVVLNKGSGVVAIRDDGMCDGIVAVAGATKKIQHSVKIADDVNLVVFKDPDNYDLSGYAIYNPYEFPELKDYITIDNCDYIVVKNYQGLNVTLLCHVNDAAMLAYQNNINYLAELRREKMTSGIKAAFNKGGTL